MNFDSALFLFAFLPLFMLANLFIKNIKYRNYLLVVTSLIFYSFGDLRGLVVLIVTIGFNFYLGQLVYNRKKYMISGVIINVLILCVYKYLGFFSHSLGYTRSAFASLVAPLGISFFIFKCISYIIDAYRLEERRAESILDFAIYVSFFPQVVAGPISRFADFKSQLVEREVTLDGTVVGLKRFIIGLAKKVIFAGTFEYMTVGAFGDTLAAKDARVALLGAVCYSMQIYLDFSGYSDMAIGLGSMCGFDTQENFNFPYAASSITDFWRRWHLSLSNWLRDYVYFSLGGNRLGVTRQAINKFIVFFVCGIWHGANGTFFLWGAWHGILSGLESFAKPKLANLNEKYSKFMKGLGHIYTLFVVMLGFVIFRASSIRHGFSVIGNMFGANGINYHGSVYLAGVVNPFTMLIAAIAVLGCIPKFVALFTGHTHKYGRLTANCKNFWLNLLVLLGFISVYIVTLMFIAAGGFSPFIYQQF